MSRTAISLMVAIVIGVFGWLASLTHRAVALATHGENVAAMLTRLNQPVSIPPEGVDELSIIELDTLGRRCVHIRPACRCTFGEGTSHAWSMRDCRIPIQLAERPPAWLAGFRREAHASSGAPLRAHEERITSARGWPRCAE